MILVWFHTNVHTKCLYHKSYQYIIHQVYSYGCDDQASTNWLKLVSIEKVLKFLMKFSSADLYFADSLQTNIWGRRSETSVARLVDLCEWRRRVPEVTAP